MRRILVGADVALVILMCFGFGSLSYLGYRGYDDFHYVYAALTLLETGQPVVTDHWSIRFPHVFALFTSLKSFGVSEWALTVPPFIGYICSAVATYFGVRHFWQRGYGLLAAGLFASTSLFAVLSNVPFVLFTQLTLIVVGFWLLIWANESNRLWLNLVAGIPIGLAILAHLTSAAVVISTTIIALLIYKNWRAWLLCALGAAAIGLADMSYFSVTQGEPLYRIKIASNHATITKHNFGNENKLTTKTKKVVSELKPVSSKSFFKFMTDDARYWEHVPVNVHWIVNPYIVFLLHYDLAIYSLAFIVILLLTASAQTSPFSAAQKRVLLALLTTAVVWLICANYIFSIRPHPRYFGPVAYAIAIALAVYGARLWQQGAPWLRHVVVVMGVGAVVMNVLLIDMRESNHTEHRHLSAYMADNPTAQIVVPEGFQARLFDRIYGIDATNLLLPEQATSSALWLVTNNYPLVKPFSDSCEQWASESRITIIGRILQLLGIDALVPEHIRRKFISPEQTIRLVRSCDQTMEVSP
ncbi:glycosyltransferase family 39 protein [Neiella sp. HB171785]|uniref:Glycosyltransferase family 39 protein n=1 Tax=Neiella litorisoli TaxID=2771431 RepID=A0A8J6QJW7_9GAMM|nr:glycosyltransferase family 39 protein [Neiella litorisoli]MBD1390563.1 glycosyltransferase family 39 protein [Neiella litorisoli]